MQTAKTSLAFQKPESPWLLEGGKALVMGRSQSSFTVVTANKVWLYTYCQTEPPLGWAPLSPLALVRPLKTRPLKTIKRPLRFLSIFSRRYPVIPRFLHRCQHLGERSTVRHLTRAATKQQWEYVRNGGKVAAESVPVPCERNKPASQLKEKEN